MIPRQHSDNTILPHISAKEMFKVSHEISRNYSPVAPLVSSKKQINASISAKELLEVSDNISLYYAPRKTSDNTHLTLLIVDPNHLYVHWNLANNQARLLLNTIYSDELVLRIYSHPSRDVGQSLSKPIFEQSIHNFQFQQEIKIPEPKQQTVYSGYIGKALSENNFVSLVKSNHLHVDNPLNSTKTPRNYFAANSPIQLLTINQFNSNTPHFADTNPSGKNDQKKTYA